MTQVSPIVNAILRGARARGVDPRAALAVASVEGLGGGVGDNGHAFGPFQLNDAGGVLTGRPGDHQAFAESQQGLNFALDKIAGVARGLHGAQAVNAIVRRFERPKDPNGEVQRALGHYGNTSAGVGAPQRGSGAAAPTAPGGGSALSPLLAALVSQTNEAVGLPAPNPALFERPASAPGSAAPATRERVTPQRISPSRSGSSLGFLEPLARKFGLEITSTTGGKHAPGSYHYQGRAVDYSGNPQREAELARYALAHPNEFVEEIYTGPGHPKRAILGGKVVPLSALSRALYAQHENHTHLAR